MTGYLAQRYAVSAGQLDRRIAQYRDRSDSPEAAYLVAVDLTVMAHTDLAGMLAIAIRRAARRQNGLRSIRRRAIRRAREWEFRLDDAEITLRDAVEERDALRQVVGEALRRAVR